MQSKVEIVIQKDGYKSRVHCFYSPDTPKLSILILHGMAEHYKRYISFANFLTSNGIDVYLYDHRGHGEQTLLKDLGFISEKEGYKYLIQDGIEICRYVNKHKRTTNFILMGHSMGSLIARNISLTYQDFSGLVVCGSTQPSIAKIKSGLLLANLITLRYGEKHKSPFFHNILFGSHYYKKLIKHTSYDWLSSNKSSVGAYIHDPYCGYTCTISFYKDLLHLAYYAQKLRPLKQLNTKFPVLIISGLKDPVSSYGKEITKIASLYKKAWSETQLITVKLYEDLKHEILQEKNAEEVMKDILNWLNKL